MSSFAGALQNCFDTYNKFLREESRRRNMTPKEYSESLKKRRKKRK